MSGGRGGDQGCNVGREGGLGGSLVYKWGDFGQTTEYHEKESEILVEAREL